MYNNGLLPVSYLLSSVHCAMLLLQYLVSCASITLGTYNCVTYISQVRVAGSRAQSTVLYIAESIVHEPSIATRVTVTPGAVHKLLLTEGGEGACLAVHLSLESTCGTKGPAGATLSLVLHLVGGAERGGRRGRRRGRRRGGRREKKKEVGERSSIDKNSVIINLLCQGNGVSPGI